jgi:hypothetical protein
VVENASSKMKKILIALGMLAAIIAVTYVEALNKQAEEDQRVVKLIIEGKTR